VEEIILQRATRKLELTQRVIEAGRFVSVPQQQQLTEDKQSLREMIKYGLKELDGDDDGEAQEQQENITDEELEVMLNPPPKKEKEKDEDVLLSGGGDGHRMEIIEEEKEIPAR